MDNEMEQMEQQSVGEILRSARLARNLSLTDVEKGTNIRARYIEAVENGEYGVLPGDVFIRGIIRTYGGYLGLDGLELVNMYKAGVAGVSAGEMRSEGIREVNRVRMNIQLKDKRDIGSGRGGFDVSMKQFAAGIIIVLLLAGGYFAVPRLIAMNSGTPAGEPKTEETAAPAPAPVQAPAAPAAPKAGIIKDRVVVAMECADKCWLEVTADGKNVFEGMMNAKEKKTFEAKEKLIIKYGNIGAMKINYNGEDVDLRGEHGVAVKTYLKK